jgi:hypothetical protein
MTPQPTHPAGSTFPDAPTNDGIARTLSRHPRPLGGDPLRNIDPPKISLQQLSLKKKPDWLRAKVPGGPEYLRLKKVLTDHKLFTVCEEANCPNMGECWSAASRPS